MRTRRAGFTLIEVLVVFLIMGVVLGAVWSLFGHGAGAAKRIAGTLDAQKLLRARFQQLIHELQGARKLFFPSPGGKSQEGVGFVDRDGHAVMVLVKEEGGEKVLYKVDLMNRSQEELARGVAAFRATVPPLQNGQVPRTVNLTFGLEAEGSEDAKGETRHLHMVTSVTLRALEERYPN